MATNGIAREYNVSELDGSVRSYTSDAAFLASLVIGSLASVVMIAVFQNGPTGLSVEHTDVSNTAYFALAVLTIGAFTLGNLKRGWFLRIPLAAASVSLMAAIAFHTVPSQFELPSWADWWLSNLLALFLFIFLFLLATSYDLSFVVKGGIIALFLTHLAAWAIVTVDQLSKYGGFDGWLVSYATCAGMFLYATLKIGSGLADFDGFRKTHLAFAFFPIGYNGRRNPFAAFAYYLGLRLLPHTSRTRRIIAGIFVVLAMIALGLSMRTLSLLFFEIVQDHSNAIFVCGRDEACIRVRGAQTMLTEDIAVPVFLFVPYIAFLCFRSMAWFVVRTSAQKVLTIRWPPAFVFLRPFSERKDSDRIKIRARPRSLFERVMSGGRRYGNLDQMIVDECLDIGSVIAIGKPGQRIPPSGAAREYVSDPDWQKVVKHRATEARGIILCLGTSKGVAWEVEHVTSTPELRERLIVLTHPTEFADPRHERLLQYVLQAFEVENNPIDDPSSVIALIGFRHGVFIITSDQRDEGSYQLALRIFLDRNQEILMGDIRVAQMELALEGLRELDKRFRTSNGSSGNGDFQSWFAVVPVFAPAMRSPIVVRE